MKNTIQMKDLCKTGQTLSNWGIPTLMKHVDNCNKCKKKILSKRKKQ